MKTNNILITFSMLVMICITSYLIGCGSSEQSDQGLSNQESKAYVEVDPVAPSGGYKIYLDASGSMPGYFKGAGLDEYIAIVSALQDANDNAEVYFWGEPNRQIKDVNSSITNGNYKGVSSLFPEIFSTMKDDVINNDVLTFIVTDGIYSNSSKVTGKRTGYSKSDLPLVPGKIKSSLEGEGLAVGVFRFTVPFNGTYYDIDNKKKPLTGVNRPLFVIAIGKPAALADFKHNALAKKETENFTDRKPKSLYLGLLSLKENENLFQDISESGTGFEYDEDQELNIIPNGTDAFYVKANIPEWITQDGIDVTSAGMLELINSAKKPLNGVTCKFKNNEIRIYTEDEAQINPEDYTLSYIISLRPATEWEQYSCKDDRMISKDTLCNLTFGIAEMIKGFELATNHPDEIYKSSFKFTKE